MTRVFSRELCYAYADRDGEHMSMSMTKTSGERGWGDGQRAMRVSPLAIAAIAVACGSSEASSPPAAPVDDAGVGASDSGEAPRAPTPPVVGGVAPDGIFVSASKGIEGADGAKTRPVKTIAAGLALASAKRLPLIVCPDTYAEAVTLVDGITMFGYFDCTDLTTWRRVEHRSVILSPTSPAVIATSLSSSTRVEGFDVQAPDFVGSAAEGPAASSFGMIVKGTTALELGEVSIRAGNGQDGRDGVEPSAGPVESANNVGGPAPVQAECENKPPILMCSSFVAVVIDGRDGAKSSCGGGAGGKGGDGPVVRNSAYAAIVSSVAATGAPATASATTAAGGAPAGLGANSGTGGSAGAFGPNGANGAWSLTADAFVPGDGTAGSAGLPGQGGGGGAGTTVLWNPLSYPAPAPFPSNSLPAGVWYGAAGAGGGAGGCGGLPGTPGTGGGASVGLLVVDSVVAFGGSSRIASAKGGRGGKGTLGTLGTSGGAGGAGGSSGMTIRGAAGGKGGDGGAAGLSGQGAPGPSIALVYMGTRPVLAGTELAAGDAGEGAAALVRGTQTMPATVGVSKKEHAL
jgi:hypothetical protein